MSAAVWQRPHGFGEHFELVILVHLLTRPGLILQDYELNQIRHGLGRLRTPAAEEIEGDVAGGGKKKRLCVAHSAIGLRAEEARVGFLHKIVGIAESGETRLQVCPQRRFMGLDLLGKPTGLFRRKHKAGGSMHPPGFWGCRANFGRKLGSKTISYYR